MRGRGLALAALIGTAYLALAPAAAAQVQLNSGDQFAAQLRAGHDIPFVVPFSVTQDGSVYAKILPTPGNAVHDGSGPNGSVEDASGWRVAFAIAREGEAPSAVGTRVDSTPSRRIAVSANERFTLYANVSVPPDALIGGATQRVYLAIAYREGPPDAGETSGAIREDALAVTLTLTAPEGAPVPSPTPASPTPTTPHVSPIVPPDDGPTPATTQRIEVTLPTWFLLATLAILAGILGALIVIARHLFHLRARLHEQPALRVPLAEEPPRRRQPPPGS